MDLKNIRVNPDNPRIISGENLDKLVASIKKFPKMLELRPIVVNTEGIILGGNQRFVALQKLGWELKEEWFREAIGLTAEEQRQFIIEDNVAFGNWDWDLLNKDWNAEELEEWGMNLPKGWGEEENQSGELPKTDKPLNAIVVVAYENINDLDKITSLYELECIDITDEIKAKISSPQKVYVFKE